MNERIISALVGLAGACRNNGKTEHTDDIVMNALLSLDSSAEEGDVVASIIKEKFTVSPNCETCRAPCGNTSDYDMEKYHQNTELKSVKEKLILEAAALAKRLHDSEKTELPEEIYQAISYFGYELSADAYSDLIQRIMQREVR